MRIRSKILLSTIIPFFITVFALGHVMNFYAVRFLEESIENDFQVLANSKALWIESYLEEKVSFIEVFSKTPLAGQVLSQGSFEAHNALPEMIEKRINYLHSIQEVGDFYDIFFIDASGDIWWSIQEKDDLGTNLEMGVYSNTQFGEAYKEAKETDDIVLSISSYYEPSDEYAQFIVAPVYWNNERVGFVAAQLNVDVISSIVENRTDLGETGEVLLGSRNEDGDVVFVTDRRFALDKNALEIVSQDSKDVPMVQALIERREGVFRNTLDYRSHKVVAATQYIEMADWGLVVKIDEKEALASTEKLLWYFTVIVTVAFSVFFFVIRWLVQRINNPLKKLTRGVRLLEKESFTFHLKDFSGDEFSDLAKAFNSLSQSLNESQKDVKRQVNRQTKEIVKRESAMRDQQRATLNILEDIEEEKSKTKVLAKDLEKFKLAVENASDHIVITDSDGMVLFANAAVERITGYSEKESLHTKAGKLWGGLMGKPFYDLLWETIKRNKKSFSGEITNVRKNGEKYEAAVSIAPILDNKGEVAFFIGIERDITKEKQIDQAKTEFVSLASHQLRTPLSSINWYAEMLMSGDAGKLNDQQQMFLDEIYKGNQRMVELVNALLNVSRIELGTFMVEPDKIDFTDLVDDLVKELQPKIVEKKIRIKKNVGKSKKLTSYLADPKLLRMVVQNLLSNAVKYTPDKGSVMITLKTTRTSVRFEVKDTGYGIPKYQQEQIFSKLFRADNVREMEAEGTGLGLYIIKSIIDHVGGKIWFESKEKKGTTFYVELPIKGMRAKKGTKKLDS